MATTVLLVEDEAAIQELLAHSLRAAGYQTLAADSGERALALLGEALPDVVLLDWMLPEMSGVELARRLRADTRTKDIPIIMLTARAEEQDKLIGLEVGADDYVTKPFSPRELLARIKAVLRRRAPQMTDDTVYIAGVTLDPTTHRVSAAGRDVALGPTEFKLLHFLMTHPERVHSRTQLLDRVWGDHVFVEERTVDVHIRRLRKALEPSDCDRLIDTVRGAGYRFTVQAARQEQGPLQAAAAAPVQ